MNKLKQVDELLKKGQPIHEAGINSWAFLKKEALEILNRLEELNVFILGGDVYVLSYDFFKPNYDNWYCNRFSNETDIEFTKRSVKTAKDFIMNYNIVDTEASQIFFAFVLDEFKND
ncbi:immunity protein 40 of polymorphic toxin system [Flavobacterium tiangeerense]|uniref:Immunity protein 40 of polymorphic toxin system n=1 Tax=Flavobacterium tiangeerense TaxID=459471 RepID=A0ABY3FN84_9FLAO|nr:Imm40 family immunity protein [Flavobacterium tiangeerense]TWI03146.1 immunity protein 40 of polymorphic toxin system [Flavobacterium tiangeerense]